MYDLIDESLNLREYEIRRMILSPNRWSRYVEVVALNWTIVKFNKTERLKIPNNKSGLYSFVVQPGIAAHPACSHLLYVGKTERQSLRTRFMQYFNEKNKPRGRPLVKRMLRIWENHLWFCYAPIEDEYKNEISKIENELLMAFVPPINKDFPAEIRRVMEEIWG